MVDASCESREMALALSSSAILCLAFVVKAKEFVISLFEFRDLHIQSGIGGMDSFALLLQIAVVVILKVNDGRVEIFNQTDGRSLARGINV